MFLQSSISWYYTIRHLGLLAFLLTMQEVWAHDSENAWISARMYQPLPLASCGGTDPRQLLHLPELLPPTPERWLNRKYVIIKIHEKVLENVLHLFLGTICSFPASSNLRSFRGICNLPPPSCAQSDLAFISTRCMVLPTLGREHGVSCTDEFEKATT